MTRLTLAEFFPELEVHAGRRRATLIAVLSTLAALGVLLLCFAALLAWAILLWAAS